MLIDETNDELFDRISSLIYILGERMSEEDLKILDRISSLIYILGERMSEEDLKNKLDDLVCDALSDIEMERKSA